MPDTLYIYIYILGILYSLLLRYAINTSVQWFQVLVLVVMLLMLVGKEGRVTLFEGGGGGNRADGRSGEGDTVNLAWENCLGLTIIGTHWTVESLCFFIERL